MGLKVVCMLRGVGRNCRQISQIAAMKIRHLQFIHICLLLLFVSELPAQPFAIGQQSVSLPDPARNNRQVTAEVYYPAMQAGMGAPMALGVFPVVVIGHGFLMTAASYEMYWEHLVPLGYVVAAATTEGSISPSHEQFGLDLAFLVSSLQAEGRRAGSVFQNGISDKSAVTGHSMGGGATYIAGRSMPSISTLVTFAAAETNPSAQAAAADCAMPALMFAGTSDCVTPPASAQSPIYQNLASSCKYFVTLSGASHCQFANTNPICRLGEIGCNITMTEARQHALVLSLLGPWLDLYLKGAPMAKNALLQRLTEPELSVQESCLALSSTKPLSARTALLLSAHSATQAWVIRLPEGNNAPAKLGITGMNGVCMGEILLPAGPAREILLPHAPLANGLYVLRMSSAGAETRIKVPVTGE